jgi:hypothetical protein
MQDGLHSTLWGKLKKDKSKSRYLWAVRQLLRYTGGALLMEQG